MSQEYTVIDAKTLVNIKHLDLFEINNIMTVIPMKKIVLLMIHKLAIMIV